MCHHLLVLALSLSLSLAQARKPASTWTPKRRLLSSTPEPSVVASGKEICPFDRHSTSVTEIIDLSKRKPVKSSIKPCQARSYLTFGQRAPTRVSIML